MSIITIKTQNSEIDELLKSLLKRISGIELLSETEEADIIGYGIDKKPIFADDYKKEIKNRLSEINKGNSKTFTTQEVISKVLKK